MIVVRILDINYNVFVRLWKNICKWTGRDYFYKYGELKDLYAFPRYDFEAVLPNIIFIMYCTSYNVTLIPVVIIYAIIAVAIYY